MSNKAVHHHYVPRFFLRNFASDTARTKIKTLAKHGEYAIWDERSIEHIGFEPNFYDADVNGQRISFETLINSEVETPITRSETWAKISEGQVDRLDQSDRPILYQLMRHLEVRTPHYAATYEELDRMERNGSSDIPFTEEERAMFRSLREKPELARFFQKSMCAWPDWNARHANQALITVLRSETELRSSTTPVLAIGIPKHPAVWLPLPGMVPSMYVLSLSPHALICLTLGEFEGAFFNRPIESDVAAGFNRQFLGQFAAFKNVRHLITSKDGLEADLEWAGYELLEKTERKMRFRLKGIA